MLDAMLQKRKCTSFALRQEQITLEKLLAFESYKAMSMPVPSMQHRAYSLPYNSQLIQLAWQQ